MSASISVTPKELAVFVELVAGFHPAEGEVRTLLSVARMFAASSQAKNSGQSVLNTPLMADDVQAVRASFARARATERAGSGGA